MAVSEKQDEILPSRRRESSRKCGKQNKMIIFLLENKYTDSSPKPQGNANTHKKQQSPGKN